MDTVKLTSIRPNPSNPRVIKDAAFHKLVANIKQYPHFLDLRGIVHADGVILGGNMRYRAIQEALKDAAFRDAIGVPSAKDIPAKWVLDASAWNDTDRAAFIIADNAPAGDWDWDMLANEWPDSLLAAFDVAPVEWPDGGEDSDGGGDGDAGKSEKKKCPHCGAAL
jgi:hypothetical protein